MIKKLFVYIFFVVISIVFPFDKCFSQSKTITDIKVGAESTENYIDLLKGKKVGIVANQTSVIGKTHLVDSLISLGINLRAIYCPEHGFRGDAEAGAKVNSSIDSKTGLPIISLYGKNKKPSSDEFKKNDIIIFDIQDVGCRFYTYISTLHYVMEACAENNIPLIVLDRPNPNGYYIDGPVLKDTSLVSFVGMHPVPIVYGMTIGEYAQMINGEGWLGTSNKRVIGEKGSLKCNLTMIPNQNYKHDLYYTLPIAPSPNLRTPISIDFYPSLCWFEGTPVSVGRGTDRPFEIIGFPEYSDTIFSFTPRVIKGISDNPPYKDIKCYGIFSSLIPDCIYSQSNGQICLKILIDMYKAYPNKDKFFQPFFDKLAGTKELKEQIKRGDSEKEIRKTWASDLKKFKQIREKYLLYK